MQLTPQSYSGRPRRVTLPGGPGDPPPPSRAVISGGISSGFNKLMRLSTLSSIVSDVLQKGKWSVTPGRQARVFFVESGDGPGVEAGVPDTRSAAGVVVAVLSLR